MNTCDRTEAPEQLVNISSERDQAGLSRREWIRSAVASLVAAALCEGCRKESETLQPSPSAPEQESSPVDIDALEGQTGVLVYIEFFDRTFNPVEKREDLPQWTIEVDDRDVTVAAWDVAAIHPYNCRRFVKTSAGTRQVRINMEEPDKWEQVKITPVDGNIIVEQGRYSYVVARYKEK